MAVALADKLMFLSRTKYDGARDVNPKLARFSAQALVVGCSFCCIATGGLLMAAINNLAAALALGLLFVVLALALLCSFFCEEALVLTCLRRSDAGHDDTEGMVRLEDIPAFQDDGPAGAAVQDPATAAAAAASVAAAVGPTSGQK